MIKNEFITIDTVQSEKGYLITDENEICIGKIEVVEYSKENKNCTFRLYFNKDKERYKYLTHIIKNFTDMLFVNAGLYKINILIKEDIEFQPFFDLNYYIEGVILSNIKKASEFYNEILLGIDYDIYKGLKTIKLFRVDGDNIYLRVLTTDDAVKLLDYYKRNKEYLRTFEELRNENFYTLDGQKTIIRQQYVKFLNGNSVYFGIFKDENIIGIIQLYNIVWGIFRSGTIGYSIDENEQGKGYMKEAVNIIVEYAFHSLKLHRLEAATLVDNIKSRSVLEACGFKKVGISEKYLFINGHWEDHYIFQNLNI